MSNKFKAKLLVAKNFVSTKMGLEGFQEPPEITQRKKDLKVAEALYDELEHKVIAYIRAWEATQKASVEMTKFVLNFSEDGQSSRQKEAFKAYGDTLTKTDVIENSWVTALENSVLNPVRSTQNDIKHAKTLKHSYLEVALEVESHQAKVRDLRQKPGPKTIQAEKELDEVTKKKNNIVKEFTELVATIYDRRLIEILQIFNSLIESRKKYTGECFTSLSSISLFIPEQLEVEKYQSLIKQAQRMTMSLAKPISFDDQGSPHPDDASEATRTRIISDCAISEYPSEAFPESPSASRSPIDAIEEDLPVIKVLTALFAYTPEEEGEIGFEEGDKINVFEMDESGWWLGECKGQRGLFPQNYTKEDAA